MRAAFTGPRRPASGFSLIEVLIALLVLSLGLLGLAALQSTTLKFNHGAYLRSQATSLAYGMADRMRANRRAAIDEGVYDLVAFTNPAPGCVTPAGTTVAGRDISEWRSALGCALPLGNGQIEREGRVVTISIRWDESRGEAAADDLEIFEMTTAL